MASEDCGAPSISWAFSPATSVAVPRSVESLMDGWKVSASTRESLYLDQAGSPIGLKARDVIP